MNKQNTKGKNTKLKEDKKTTQPLKSTQSNKTGAMTKNEVVKV